MALACSLSVLQYFINAFESKNSIALVPPHQSVFRPLLSYSVRFNAIASSKSAAQVMVEEDRKARLRRLREEAAAAGEAGNEGVDPTEPFRCS